MDGRRVLLPRELMTPRKRCRIAWKAEALFRGLFPQGGRDFFTADAFQALVTIPPGSRWACVLAICLTTVSAPSASARVAVHRPSPCQRLKGHDLAPARTVKLYQRDGGLIGCVLPRGPVRLLADTFDQHEGGSGSFKLRAVAGGFALFDSSAATRYATGTATNVYHIRTGVSRVIAANYTGPEASTDAHFTARAAYIDGSGRCIAAIESVDDGTPRVVPITPRVTIQISPPFLATRASPPRILDQGTPDEIPAASLMRTGNQVTWLHSGVQQSVPFG
jgi:hypothetical protein